MASTVEFTVIYDHLPALVERLPGAVNAVMAAGTERMAAYARANHPWQNRTGYTESTLRSEQSGPQEFSFLGGGAMPFLEWGTIHMPPFPTMQPAFDAVKPSIDDALGRMEEKFL
jgi:HK97 gp10 family phage protein